MEVKLGGLAVTPLASGGFPEQSYQSAGDGVTEDRRTGGTLVKMVHFRKTIITISGTGLMGLGFDGLDFDQPLELLCTKPRYLIPLTLEGVIPGQIRPDVAPWALARVGNREIPTGITMTGNNFEITPKAGATSYKVGWLPRFLVSCEPPDEALRAGELPYSWSFDAREV
ncbi:hypothetical protein ACPA5B_11610 [Pseudomonas solani]|uniref:hypothetical protein n=1 Tax=Pseudomonas solani TaxID=2731552 RepID=UPI003C2B53E9